MPRTPLSLIEFPADDPARALRFWTGVLGVELIARSDAQGDGWQTAGDGAELGLHARGRGPGDTHSLPYFEVDDLAGALAQTTALGGKVIHGGERWAVCRDSEGSPFGLAARAATAAGAPSSAAATRTDGARGGTTSLPPA
jgi:predicted enzyme related to lactoylglutathione lyase